MIYGFTGTRKGMTPAQKQQLERLLRAGDEFHHGDCVGADAEAHDIAMSAGCRIVVHPSVFADLRAYKAGHFEHPPRLPLYRNEDIVAACDVLIAAPDTPGERTRSGTWATVRLARAGQKPLVLLLPPEPPKERAA